MNNSDLTLKIIAALNKQLSKKQIKNDLKTLDNSMFVKIISMLSKTLSQRQLKKDLKQLNNLYVQIGANVKVDKNTKNQLQKRIKALGNSIAAIDVGLKVSKSKGNSDVSAARKAVQANANKTPVTFDIEVKRNKAIADVENLGKRFSKLFANVSAKQKYEKILMSAYSISDDTQLKSMRNQIASFTSELKANDLASQSLSDKWKGLITKCKELFSATSIVTAIFTQVRQAVSTFLQLDTAMTNLYKVQDQITSRDQFSGLLTKWNKLAQNLAVTTESLINSAAEWSKIGFDLDMSEQLAEITSIFEKTAEISNEKATSTLISAAQEFTEIDDLGVDDYVKRVEAVGNKINAIGNQYGIDSEGIADGLQNASAVLKVAGNDLNETIALITATNKIYQDPSESSNMLKVASLRLRGQVDALEALGEDTESVSTDLTKIHQQIYELTGNKVNIFEDEENLKSTYHLVLEIGEVFDSLNDRQQADLLETMFGKQHAGAGASLLLNYEELEKIKNDSMNADNSMAEEYSKYMESAEAHITIFKEKLIETYSAFMSGDLIKYTADIGSGLLDLVNSTDLLKHSILAVLALNIGKSVSTVGAAIVSTSKQMTTLGSALQQMKDLPFDDDLRKDAIDNIGEATKSLTEKNLKLLLSQKQLIEDDQIAILTKHKLTEDEAKAKLEKLGLTTATNAQSAANIAEAATTTTLKGAMLSLKTSIIGVGTSIKAAFLSNPIGVALTVITTTISIATTVISKYNEKLEEQKKILEKQKEKLEVTKEAYENVKSALKEVADELQNVQERIEKLENITNPTWVEQEELDRLREVTTELELQKRLKQDEQLNAAETLYKDNKNTFHEEFKGSNGNSSVLGLREQLSSGNIGVIKLDYKNNITDALAALQYLNEEKEKLTDNNEIAEYDLFIEEITNSLKTNIKSKGQGYLSSISEYKQNILEIASIRDLTEDEQDFYDYLSSIQKSIYEFYNPATWNNLKFDSIFDTNGIEVTKEKLIEMYKSGELSSEEMLKSFPKLSSAIEDSELIADEGSNKFKEFYNEIASLTREQKEFSDGISNGPKSDIGIPETIERFNTQLKPAFDAVQSAWQDIFTDNGFTPENIDLSILNNIKSVIDDFNKNEELGISINYSSFDNLAKILTDVNTTEQQAKEALNHFVTEIFNASTATDGMTEETVQLVEQMLKSMGVVNAEEVALNALSDAKARAVIDSYNLFDASEENIASMLNEAQAAGITKEQIFKLAAAEQAFNNDNLNPKEKIEKLKELATAYGQTAIAAHISGMETAADDGHMVIDYEKELASIQNAINNSINNVSINFSPKEALKTRTATTDSGSDTYLEEYKHKLEELQTMLDQELINEKEFYEQSDALLNEYLKDTPAHMQKYADEISNAEKTLRGNWISSFGYEKSQLEKELSDNALVQWQYYEQLSELAEKYYNTEGASYGKFADEYDEITREIKEGQEKLWEDIFGEINTRLDDLQSACETVGDAVTEYSENGSLSIDTMQKLLNLEPQYMALLFDENGQLQLNAEAYERLAKTKLEEMKVDLANQALNTINGLENETQAVELLTGKYAELRDTSLDAVEARLQLAIAEAHERGEKQGQAADMMMQVYQNQKNVIDMTDFSLPSLMNSENDKSEKEFLNTFDWIGTLLEKISDKTSKLIDKVDKFYSWQKKNTMINRAVKATDKEINQNERAYQSYMKKANSVGLSLSYVNKVQNGTLSLEDITNEALADKIDAYQDWYNKAQSCLDTIEDLYDKQRDLIRQKLDNVLDYYSDMDSYLSSITSKIESVISLNDDMGKRTSLTELVEQFASISDQLESVTTKNTVGITVAEGSLGDLKKVAETDSTAAKQTEADRLKGEIGNIQSDLENTATYQNLLKTIEKTKGKIAELDRTGYDRLTRGQKKTYDKLKAQLEDYYAQKESLDKNATAANIAEYNKTYLAWKKLQDKLDSGKNLSESQWKQYNSYTKQLENFADEKADTISELNDALEEARNPSDKLGQIEKTYEESAKGISDSYQKQIDGINGETENTKQYQNLLAKAQQLEQKKDTKKLSKSEQAKLDKYNAELEALQTGATGSNISDYMKTWEAWYKLEQKLDNRKKLSDSEAKKYDTYKAQLEAWNNEKQTQINDLLSLMEDDLEQLQKTYTENVSEAESEVNDYYANLYSLAKQIAEYNITTLQAQLDKLDAFISYYKELVSLYDSFDGGKLVKILKDLGEIKAEDEVLSRLDVYSAYLDNLQEKYDTTLSEMNEYKQLLISLDTKDFEKSMNVFNKALEIYKASGDTVMADKLQSVLDLLNKRAIDADNWGEFADQWAAEWEKEFASAKQGLIGVATEIQEVNDALRDIRFEHITDAIDELEKASEILSSIADLIKDEWLFEPDGSLSEYGRAKAALLVSQLEDAQSEANEYLKLYNEIQNNKDTYASDKAFKDASNEALQNYYDSLNSAASLENSILDLMKKNAEEEINSLKDVIEARKKTLQAKKDYYDYDKSIKNSQKEIDSLKAQIDALESLSDATDAATKAKLAQIKAELSEKEDALQETKDEHTFNLQIDALDKFSESLTDALDESTKSVEEILKEQKEIIVSAKDLYQTSTDSVNNTLDKVMAFYRGMGMSIDGADFAPDTDTVYDNTANADLGLDNAKTDAVGKFIAEASEAFKNGILVRTNDAQILNVFDENMLDYLQTHVPQIAFDVRQTIPDTIREQNTEQSVVINNHYDNLINVEGSVDRSFAGELRKTADTLYSVFADKLYHEVAQVGGCIHVNKSI